MPRCEAYKLIFRRFSVAVLVVGGAVAIGSAVEAADLSSRSAVNAALDSITTPNLLHHVEILASDALEGREAGSRGGRAASIYLLEQIRHYPPLKPAGVDGGYFQPFDNGCRNILTLLEGSDPQLKQQVIVVSAHYDHVGYGNRGNSYGPIGRIHNGADDNASGSSGLLELAAALTRLEVAPRRTILFAFWDGEEEGLLGSQYFVDNPTIPLSRIVLEINMDMIGRLRKDKLYVYGTRTSPGLRHAACESNRQTNLNLDFTWELKRNSDHYTFFAHEIPVVMLHTGLHEDYHRPSDRVEKINAEGMHKVVHLLFSLVYGLGQQDRLGGFREASRQEAVEPDRFLQAHGVSSPGRLGIDWASDKVDAAGLPVSTVRPGSAADRAGLRPGDRIVRCDEQPVKRGADLRGAVVVADQALELEVVRTGAAKPLEMAVKLDGRPQRLGITWLQDDADPGVVVVASVSPDSPADRSGLRLGDRIWELDGQSVHGGQDFQRRIATSPGAVNITLERQGRLRSLRVDLPGVKREQRAPAANGAAKSGQQSRTLPAGGSMAGRLSTCVNQHIPQTCQGAACVERAGKQFRARTDAVWQATTLA